ncbi:MAG: 30S ribosomal protein S9 [Candidatus Hodgkinia cicadicola]
MYKTQTFLGGIKANAFKKSAKATVRVAPNDEFLIFINGAPLNYQFDDVISQMIIMGAFEAVASSNFIVIANTWGGGIESQAQALRHAITKCLIALNRSSKAILAEYGYVSTDCRKVERKKCGLAKARKAFQFSKR